MKLYINLIASFLIASISFAGDIELQNPSTNQKAPDFSGMNTYGEMIRLSNFIGKPVILEWTNHECPYVARHYDENNMQTVQKIAQDQEIIWLSIISSTPGDQGHVGPKGAIDDIGRGMQFFDASFPKAVNYVSSQFPELLAQETLSTDSTVAYGCSVKYNYD